MTVLKPSEVPNLLNQVPATNRKKQDFRWVATRFADKASQDAYQRLGSRHFPVGMLTGAMSWNDQNPDELFFMLVAVEIGAKHRVMKDLARRGIHLVEVTRQDPILAAMLHTNGVLTPVDTAAEQTKQIASDLQRAYDQNKQNAINAVLFDPNYKAVGLLFDWQMKQAAWEMQNGQPAKFWADGVIVNSSCGACYDRHSIVIDIENSKPLIAKMAEEMKAAKEAARKAEEENGNEPTE